MDTNKVSNIHCQVKTCSNHLVMGRQCCKVEKEMVAIMEYHIWSELLVTFPKIIKGLSLLFFPPRFDSLQKIEKALLTVPLVVICEPVV